MNNLLITYTYNNTIVHSVIVNKHTYSLTLNMNMKPFHIPEVIHGFLLSQLGLDASDALIEAILTYPEDVNQGKNVTVILDVDGFGS